MEQVSLMNYSQQVTLNEGELIVKEEINEDFIDGEERSVKCGEVFFLQTEQMVLICGFCQESYNNMNEFGVHVQGNHLNKKHAVEKHEPVPIEDVFDGSQDYEDVPDDEDESKEMDCEDVEATSKIENVSEQSLQTKTTTRSKRPINKIKAQQSVLKNPDLYCTICQKQYENNARFRLHNEKKHNILRPCEFCSKPFDSLDERSEHEKTHVGDSPYPCPKCSMLFRKKYTRDKHIEHVHEGIRPHKCSVCDRSFSTGTILRAHLVVHSLSGRYSCEFCGRQFAHASVMKLHVKRHKGEKTFQCEECGNRYLTQTLLSYHMKGHKGEKTVECEICGKKFYTRRRLTDHLRVHSTVKRYTCPTCGAGFKKCDSMKQHMKLHSDVKEYSCNICGKAFAQAAGLYSHKKSHIKDVADWNPCSLDI